MQVPVAPKHSITGYALVVPSINAVSKLKLLMHAVLDEQIIYIGFINDTVFSQEAAPEHYTYE